jgi:hypothetical protein
MMCGAEDSLNPSNSAPAYSSLPQMPLFTSGAGLNKIAGAFIGAAAGLVALFAF